MAFLLCPKCKSSNGTVSIYDTRVILTVMEDGTDCGGDHEYENGNPASCECGWEGTVGELLDGDEIDEIDEDDDRDCPNCIDGVHYSDPAVAEQHRKDSDSAKEPAS